MPFYIRVASLINPVHGITKTEEPKLNVTVARIPEFDKNRSMKWGMG